MGGFLVTDGSDYSLGNTHEQYIENVSVLQKACLKKPDNKPHHEKLFVVLYHDS
jgi:hypothetical protein